MEEEVSDLLKYDEIPFHSSTAKFHFVEGMNSNFLGVQPNPHSCGQNVMRPYVWVPFAM